MDQKCTPDVVCIIADCIMNFLGDDTTKSFTVNDIWSSQYFIKNVKIIFNKPSATDNTTRSEYDKFIQQPLRMLAYGHILDMNKIGNTNHYSVKNIMLLEYISLKDRNAYTFLCEYLEKVLKDSGIYKDFEAYQNHYLAGTLDNKNFSILKSKFQKFIIWNTSINGFLEINRIYPKILNIFASQYSLPWTIWWFLSSHEFSYSDLMYNRKNWRDIKKNKNISRQDSEKEYDMLISETDNPYNNYLVQKAMTTIRKLYADSEVYDQWANSEATEVHHIFPKHKFPMLAHYLENLIKLTPTQHHNQAHPKNKTTEINSDYQLVCLLAKADSIAKSIRKNEIYYRRESFIYCINTWLGKDFGLDFSLQDVKTKLVLAYNDNP